MKNMSRLILFALIILTIILASCAKKADVLKTDNGFVIEDNVYFHNMGITFDGNYYYTINGGNDGYSLINVYDKRGKFIKKGEPGIDARSIHYIDRTGDFYIKAFGVDIMNLNINDFTYDVDYDYYMWGDNSSVSFDPACNYLYELFEGEIIVVDAEDGLEVNNFYIDRYYDEHLYNSSIAVGEKYIYIWGSPSKIYMYDFDGNIEDSITVKMNGYAPSLSYCNGMLWLAEDADASTSGGNGYWYGFKVE